MAETITLQPDAAAGDDTYIDNQLTTTNFGTNASLLIGESNAETRDNRCLIKFDLSSIPAGSQIISATLSLWQFAELSNNARDMRVFLLKRVWVETEATWNEYSSGNSWQNAGGFGVNDAQTSPDIGLINLSATESAGEKQITLTASAIQDLLTGGSFTNNGFIIKMNTENEDQQQFRSSDYGTAGERPKLAIVYSPPTGGAGFWF